MGWIGQSVLRREDLPLIVDSILAAADALRG
jgi:hypothetical protein